jgi:long-chain acyl-CoA synthetase
MRWTDDAIGDVPACIEIKLVDFPEAGYYSHSQPPQGEIWIRGTAALDGYYKDEQQTTEALTPDGWLKTGDIGEWDKNGHLRIIDRKKNLVKTMNGEYIALEKVCSFIPVMRDYLTNVIIARVNLPLFSHREQHMRIRLT